MAAGTVFLLGGSVLGYLARKRMGVLRSLMYRNEKLQTTLLSPEVIGVVQLLIMLLTALVLLEMARKRPKKEPGQMRIFSLFIGAVLLFECLMYAQLRLGFMGLPWMSIGGLIWVITFGVHVSWLILKRFKIRRDLRKASGKRD